MSTLKEGAIDDLRRASLSYAALCSWSSAGLFDALADDQARSASELGVSARGLEVTGQVLRSVGLVEVDEGRWRLSHAGLALQRGGALNLGKPEEFFRKLAGVGSALVTGDPLERRDIGVDQSDPARTRAFLEMLYRRSGESAVETARLLSSRIHSGAKVLDLGGGHGRYGEELRSACDARVTLLDLEVSIGVAQQRYGTDQSYVVGDFMSCDLGSDYDVVLASNVVHGLGPDQLSLLLPRLATSLAPDGLLVLKDMFIGGGCAPGLAESFGMQMLIGTAEGRSYSLEQITDLLDGAGFSVVECLPVPECDFSLLISRQS